MYSPAAPLLDHRDVKQNITKKLSSSLRALQMRYVTTDEAITSDDDEANGFCVALEAVFIHGLKVKFIRTQANKRRNKGRPFPQPAFWPLLQAVTHRNVIAQLEAVSYISSDVGRCRSWLRLALNDSLLECYFLALQREKSRLAEYYQPCALLLDVEQCDVVLSYLQGLSSLTFSLSYKSSILNEWTASPLTLSALWLEDVECVVHYETHRRKSLDSVSQSSGSDDTSNSMISNAQRPLESSSLSLDNSSSSSQLSSSLGSDEQPLIQVSVPSACPLQLPDRCDVVEGAAAGIQDTNAGTSDPSLCSLSHLPIPQDLKAGEENTKASEETTLNSNSHHCNLMVSAASTWPPSVDAHYLPAFLGNGLLLAQASPTAEPPKSRSWISEDDFQTECPVLAVYASSQLPDVAGSAHLKPPVAGSAHLKPPVAGSAHLKPPVAGSAHLKPPVAAFHVVHRRQIGLPNPFRGLLMMGSLERKNALGLYKPYYCELTPYELRLHVEGDEQNCAESCSLLRCESMGPANSDGRFDIQFPNKRLYLRAPSKDEAQDWVDRIQEAVQMFRPQQEDCWEILHCLDSPSERAPSCRVFDWTLQVDVEPDALKESIVYMKVHKSWTRFMFSLSERALKCFVPRSGEKALYNVYTAEMMKDILPDSSLGSPSCFRLVTTKGSLQLQAESAAEAKVWRELVRAVFLESEDDAVLFLKAANFHIKPHIRDHLLFQYLLHIPTERGLDTQNLKCAGCHKQIGFHFGKVKLCAFSGLYYCDLCHQDEVSIIPSRIVHNWDLLERAVSRPALNFLKMVRDEPVFNLKCLNDQLYRHTQTMCELSCIREKLRLLGEYLMTCRSGALRELTASLDQRDYLLDCAHTYSVQDLKQIADGAYEPFLQSAVEFATSHVYRCDLCSQRGFICQICNQDDIIYPFQFDTTIRCGDCKAVFHKSCRTPATRCPRCERRRKCQEQRVGM